MTERLPYEEQLVDLLDTLPLPDENMAWADMKRRLEEDEDRPLLPFWLRGCAGWGMLGIVLLGLGWWIVRPEKWFTKKQHQLEEVKELKEVNDNGEKPKKNTINYTGDSTGTNEPTIYGKDSFDLKQKETRPDSVTVTDSTGKKIRRTTIQYEKDDEGTAEIEKGKKKKLKKDNPVITKGNPGKISKKRDNQRDNPDSNRIVVTPIPITTDTLTVGKIVTTALIPDSVKTIKKDTAIKKAEEVKPAVSKKDSSQKKSFSFSAGIALHQQLPVAGQSFVPYNSLGRKGTLLDYIPSVYARLNRDDKWFVQIGFRYGAPQLVNKLLYSSKADTISIQKYNNTNTYLKKTFYHQLPISFNYFVSKNLSIGGGVVWNKFNGAVSSKDVVQVDRFTGDDTLLSSNEILNVRKADSNFQKSYFQASVEAQYKWKRFSFGANYSFGLQPYIKFDLPGGATQEEKNKALQLFIRYELWKSKKK